MLIFNIKVVHVSLMLTCSRSSQSILHPLIKFCSKMLCWLFKEMPSVPTPIVLFFPAVVFKRKVQCYVTCEFN